MTTSTPVAPRAGIGAEAPELDLPSSPTLTLVRDAADARIRVPWTPVIAGALVIGASVVAAAPLTDALSGRPAVDAALQLPLSYRLLAPIVNILDTIALFSKGQHFAFLITCALAYASWRLIRRHRTVSSVARARDEVVAACNALFAVVALYVGGTVVPRPTARLAMSSPDAVTIDFHSHTRYSWDGRSSFSPESSRRWHQASGFDVAYVTDHSTFAGAEQAALYNPVRAGEGTVMLSGIEVRAPGSHPVVLGTDASDWQSFTAGNLQEVNFRRVLAARGAERPVVLFTLPGRLKFESGMLADAIEVSDGAPRGLSQSDAQRGSILELVRIRNKAVIAGSNNHGLASASPAWSVMEIPDWRAMSPAQLDTAIRREILRRGPTAVRVIDRRAPAPVSFGGLALTVPGAAWRMLVTMSWPERVSWLIWIWVSYGVALGVRRLRGRLHTVGSR